MPATLDATAPTEPSPETPRGWTRMRVRVQGIVQGVGFRPFVHRLAYRHQLAGFVYNDDDGVLLEVEGWDDAVSALIDALQAEAPQAAVVERVSATAIPARHTGNPDSVSSLSFSIEASPVRAGGTVPISPDLATCDDCWREFNDPADRRYRYPFLNCTQCGPRFTIVLDVPYDRARTTMRGFTMCPACQQEYDDPDSRRFHAEPNACPVCGPALAWHETAGGTQAQTLGATPAESPSTTPLDTARAAMRRGAVIAVKSLGGYHLVCDATNANAVATLRTRKHRPDKPLAILVADIATLTGFATVSDAAASALRSPAHPIVLVPHLATSPIAPAVAPHMDTIGAMLPALPLHALLAADGPLVCTSANLSDEPIAWNDQDALTRLAGLVDGFLTHNRPIEVPCDDSVVQIDQDGRERPVRRSRGYAPLPIRRPDGVYHSDRVLAVGAELKATIGVLQGDHCFLSAHIGDVASPETLNALRHATHHLERLHAATPDRVACDLHPGYLSAAWAEREAAERGVPLVRVQHHHAHLVSLMAEHGLGPSDTLLAFTFDGTGYGTDGTIWGGEVLLGGYHTFERLASITPFSLAGGDAAVKQPWRAALGLLHALHMPFEEAVALQETVSPLQRRTIGVQLARGLGCATTTSAGRLLDACAALAGGRPVVSYEGQGAVEFEALAQQATAEEAAAASAAVRYHMVIDREIPDSATAAVACTLQTAPLVQAVLDDVRAQQTGTGPSMAFVARAVHESVARGMRDVARLARMTHGVTRVGLTGGVFQNRLLSDLARAALTADGFAVLEHQVVPSNDGGLALGQALIAACADVSTTPSARPS